MTDESLTRRLLALTRAAGAEDLSAEAAALDERIVERRFHVACVGQFKRGKSTLINALIGRALLPTGVVPVTSVPTILRYGPPGARVLADGAWSAVPVEALSDYVAEQGNPGNAKGIQAVEVRGEAALLESGLCLVDTPGIGSVIAANSESTREIIPRIDAAVVVLGADPPITGDELRLVEAIAAETGTLLFVVNKSDRVAPTEIEEAREFIETTLRDRLDIVAHPIYRVSAIAGGGGPDWPSFQERLLALGARHREVLVRGALARGVRRIGGALVESLRERVAALTRPIEESRQRAAEMVLIARSAERRLFELAPLLGAEESRLEREFTKRAEVFVEEAVPAGLTRLREALAESSPGHASRESVLDEANGIARTLINSWLGGVEAEAEAEYGRVVRHFGEVGLDGFLVRRHFAFTDRTGYHYPRSPLTGVLDRLIPASVRRRSHAAAAERYLADLLRVNASRIVGDLAERVRESRREAEAEIRRSLRRRADSAARAVEEARAIRAGGIERIEREVARLHALVDEVERLLASLRKLA